VELQRGSNFEIAPESRQQRVLSHETIELRPLRKRRTMSREITKYVEKDSDESRENLMLLGGSALLLAGAGLLLATPTVRRYLHDIGIERRLRAAVPELDRYMRRPA
jgi:hypothetical protein